MRLRTLGLRRRWTHGSDTKFSFRVFMGAKPLHASSIYIDQHMLHTYMSIQIHDRIHTRPILTRIVFGVWPFRGCRWGRKTNAGHVSDTPQLGLQTDNAGHNLDTPVKMLLVLRPTHRLCPRSPPQVTSTNYTSRLFGTSINGHRLVSLCVNPLAWDG